MIKKTARLSFIYIIGDLTAKGAAFLLLPLYTQFLTTEDYGTLAITSMIIGVLSTLLSFGLAGTVLRFHFTLEVEQRRPFYGAVWSFLIIVPGLLVLLMSFFSQPFFGTLFEQVPFRPYIFLAIWIVFLQTAFSVIPLAQFRARDQAIPYVLLNLGTFFTTALFTVWFVVLQQQGAYGALLAQLYSAILIAVVSTIILLRWYKPNFHWRLLQPGLAFGLPFVPHFLSQWALSVSDRAILEQYVDLDQIGIYSLAYQFAVAHRLVMSSINNPFMTMFGRAAEEHSLRRTLPQMTTYFVLATSMVGIGVVLMSDDVIRLMARPDFHTAGLLVPWLVVGFIFMAFYFTSMNWMIMIKGKTNAVPVVTSLAALLNIGLNLYFVPQYGIWAAAVNTSVGYFALAGMMFFASQRVEAFPYQYGRLAKILVGVLVAITAGFATMRFEPLVNLTIGATWLLSFPLLLALLNFWTVQEKTQFVTLYRRLMPRASWIG